MSILDIMVSTEKRYTSDNFRALRGSVTRGEFLYRIRLYSERPQFQTEHTGSLRMRMLLGFIEARAVVIDAVVKSEGTLHYLSVLCSSAAAPSVFSAIMRKTVPGAIIEETEEHTAEEWVSARSLRSGPWNSIPLSGAVRVVNDSRRILVSLLLEYRALLFRYSAAMESGTVERSRAHPSLSRPGQNLAVSFLIFEHEGSLSGIPDFQVSGISRGANGSSIIELAYDGAQRVIVCDELVCIKEIPLMDITFVALKREGLYSVSVPASDGEFGFSLFIL